MSCTTLRHWNFEIFNILLDIIFLKKNISCHTFILTFANYHIVAIKKCYIFVQTVLFFYLFVFKARIWRLLIKIEHRQYFLKFVMPEVVNYISKARNLQTFDNIKVMWRMEVIWILFIIWVTIKRLIFLKPFLYLFFF